LNTQTVHTNNHFQVTTTASDEMIPSKNDLIVLGDIVFTVNGASAASPVAIEITLSMEKNGSLLIVVESITPEGRNELAKLDIASS
jgi:predicted nicotinamide N-methyase